MRRGCCVKCSSTQCRVTLNGKDPYCEGCFLHYVTHRFRATLGKRKIFKNPSQSKSQTPRVLIALSGGPSSSALSSLVIESTRAADDKRLKIEPTFLHLIEQEKPTQTDSHFFGQFLAKTPTQFDFFVASLPTILFDRAFQAYDARHYDQDELELVHSRNWHRFSSLIGSVKSETSLLDFFTLIKLRALLLCAKKLGFDYLMTGDSCSSLGAKCLINVALGRGDQVTRRLALTDHFTLIDDVTSDDAITVIRPIKELDSKAVAFYNRFIGTRTFPHEPAQIAKIRFSLNCSSIQRETEQFVTDLASKFPATLYTLMSTATKLSASSSTQPQSQQSTTACALCCCDILHSDIVDEPASDCQSLAASACQTFESDGQPFAFDCGKLCYGCDAVLSDVICEYRDLPWFLHRVLK